MHSLPDIADTSWQPEAWQALEMAGDRQPETLQPVTFQPVTLQPVSWQPVEVAGAAADATHGAPSGMVLFEVSPEACVPDALLAPARAAAQSAGYLAGWTAGAGAARAEAEREATARRAQLEQQSAADRAALARAIDAVSDAAAQLRQRAVASAEQAERLILAAAYDIAEALVGRALADDGACGRAAVERALSHVPQHEPVTVSLSPADHALVSAGGGFGPHVTLVADAALQPGDAYASCGATEVDARLAAGLERVRAVLGVQR